MRSSSINILRFIAEDHRLLRGVRRRHPRKADRRPRSVPRRAERALGQGTKAGRPSQHLGASGLRYFK
jgi:hypothetical protein